jgi:hypothetical protein
MLAMANTSTMTGLLSRSVEWWTTIYSNHATLRTAVAFAHVGGLVGGGGCAIAADRATLRLTHRDPAPWAAHFATIRRAHRIVVFGLVLIFVSGGLLAAADLATYLGSKVFWIKMALVAALLVNGTVLVRAEGHAASGQAAGLRRLQRAAAISIALWFLTTLLGTALPNIG